MVDTPLHTVRSQPAARSRWPLVLFTFILLCAGLGVGRWIRAAFLVEKPAALDPIPAATSSVASAALVPPAGHVVVLLLGVRSLAASPPELEMSWVANLSTHSAQSFWIIFSPESYVVLPRPAMPTRLGDIYAKDVGLKRGPAFTIDALQVILPGMLPPQTEIVFDRAALSAAIDDLGGIQLGGQTHGGEAVFALYDALPPGEPRARLEFEAEVLQAILLALSARGEPAAGLLTRLAAPSDSSALATLVHRLPAVSPEAQILLAPLGATPTPAP